MNDPKIIVALDKPTEKEIFDIVVNLRPELCKVKIGLEAFVRYGPRIVHEVHSGGFDVFLDLKITDTPRTLGAVGEQINQTMNVWGMTVFALCGKKSMEALYDNLKGNKTKLFGVTILTSLGEQDIDEMGFKDDIPDLVLRLSTHSYTSGFTGVVCSAYEAGRIKKVMPDFVTICPGIRPSNTSANDHSRMASPIYAVRNGADYLVIGRPITEAKDPHTELLKITEEIS